MLEKLKLVEARYLEMAERAAQPDFYNDPKAASQLLKEQRQLEPIITAYRSYMKTTQEQDDLRAMLSEGREFIRYLPHLVLFPGLSIMITVLALNLLGDGLRDALDPQMK